MPGQVGSVGGQSLVGITHQATVRLNNTQVKGLPTTVSPVLLVGPQGANRMVVFLYGALISHIVTPYTGMAETGGCQLIIASGANEDVDQSQSIDNAAPSLDASSVLTSSQFRSWLPGLSLTVDFPGEASKLSPDSQTDAASAANQGLYLFGYNGGVDFGGGNAANYLQLSITYAILDLNTGIFS